MIRGTARQLRTISGVAPVIYFPSTKACPDQVATNTKKVIDTIRAQLGEKPAPYTRKYATDFKHIKGEVDAILGSCGSDEAPLQDGKEITQMQVIERVLRHGICSYEMNEGNCSPADMEKWLLYTATDSQEFSKLQREAEEKKSYDAFKASNPETTLPEFDWAAEYANAVDREVVAEKRLRYEKVAATTFARDEAAIKAELEAYKRPAQDKLLDNLIDQINTFKPFLAKQVIQAKLIERNIDGQLTFSRFADWNPDARDAAEVLAETRLAIPDDVEPLPVDETVKRYADVRMKTKEEIIEKMDSVQQAEMAASGGGGSSMSGGDARRAALMQEIMRLQAGASSKDDSSSEKKETKEEKAAREEAARLAHEKEMARFNVPESVVLQQGVLGLEFMETKALPKEEKVASA
eukprot:TRINITY_DN3351_c0_g2_i1.p1 TRINITY_DN3351_c0_g2~~TRINITY_DN3351_c0_g2_i1.p1  ORF type:complete len:408 (+),score=116.43 TRINITY_DN3351_c0_g2_i1:56-1279(+)